MAFNSSITKDELRELAQKATSDFINNGTPLTEAVVKCASQSPLNFTAEHVRRICEMTYHDAYERMHKSASGADRFISFDPPDAVLAAQSLRAEKVAQARVHNNNVRGNFVMTDKVASSRPKFTPINAFDELVKQAQESKDVNWHDPYKTIRDAQQTVLEAKKEVSLDLGGVKTAYVLEFEQLCKEAMSLYKDGYSLEDILHACVDGADLSTVQDSSVSTAVESLAVKVASAIKTTAGMPINTQSQLGEVNPDHPLPKRFGKVASLDSQRMHLELTLDELSAAQDYVNERLKKLYQ